MHWEEYQRVFENSLMGRMLRKSKYNWEKSYFVIHFQPIYCHIVCTPSAEVAEKHDLCSVKINTTV